MAGTWTSNMVGVLWGTVAGIGVFAGVFAIMHAVTTSVLRKYVNGRNAAFKKGILCGRMWLAEFIADAECSIDNRDVYLKSKKHAGKKSSEIVKEIKMEIRETKKSLIFYKYIVKSYEEYFPFLADYRDAILDETVPLSAGVDNAQHIQASDPVVRYVSNAEYGKLSQQKRNQLALDRYVQRQKQSWEIGRMYERYIGFIYETEGWEVCFHGAIKGFDDLGRDLICRKDGCVVIIQAKCWSVNKVIREKHVFQLYGSALLYKSDNPNVDVKMVLCVTTGLSDVAARAALELGISVRSEPLRVDYPMIKCNVSSSSGEKIYHLPFDQQYDKIKIVGPSECYVETVAKAEKLGFRRAFRFSGGTGSAN